MVHENFSESFSITLVFREAHASSAPRRAAELGNAKPSLFSVRALGHAVRMAVARDERKLFRKLSSLPTETTSRERLDRSG